MKLPTKFSLTNYMYTHVNVCKRMTNVRLLGFHKSTWNHLGVCKKWAQARLRMLSTKWVYKLYICPIGWGCRIHRLHLCREVRPPHLNECPGYDTKQSDGEVPVLLGLWEMWSTLHSHCSKSTLAPNSSILMLNWIVWIRTVWLNWIAWNSLNLNCFWHWNCIYAKLICLI